MIELGGEGRFINFARPPFLFRRRAFCGTLNGFLGPVDELFGKLAPALGSVCVFLHRCRLCRRGSRRERRQRGGRWWWQQRKR